MNDSKNNANSLLWICVRYISQSIGPIGLLVSNLLLNDSKKDYFVLYLQILSKFEVISKLKEIFFEKLQLGNGKKKRKRIYQ